MAATLLKSANVRAKSAKQSSAIGSETKSAEASYTHCATGRIHIKAVVGNRTRQLRLGVGFELCRLSPVLHPHPLVSCDDSVATCQFGVAIIYLTSSLAAGPARAPMPLTLWPSQQAVSNCIPGCVPLAVNCGAQPGCAGHEWATAASKLLG
jgi:hypothetical protein